METNLIGTPYRLTLKGPDGLRYARYSAIDSVLIWEDDGSRIDLRNVGFNYPSQARKQASAAFQVAPWNPAKKTTALKKIKIQLGLKCNYSCSYCNQGGQPNRVQGNIKDVETFMATLPTWFDGGQDGLGKGVQFEFWGGEPLVYFRVLKPLAEAIRERYPNSQFNMISNLSLLTDDISEWLIATGFSVGMSHDGPGYEKVRGEDPLKDPEQKLVIRRLFDRLAGIHRFGFNCVLTKDNPSLFAIRRHIAENLGVSPDQVPLTTEEMLLPYSEGGLSLSPQTEREHDSLMQQFFWEGVTGVSMSTSTLRAKCEEFFRSLADGRSAFTLGQKCGMDRDDNIAVTLKGDVVTCQNTTSESRHRIGNIEAFEDIRLTTATHWNNREECKNCPVVQLCQGACMFLNDGLWTQACDNSFTWNLSVLAMSLYWLTRMVLVEIEGPVLRRSGLPNKMKVIELNDEIIRLRTGRAPQHVTATAFS